MSGRRINSTSFAEQTWFIPTLRVLVDRMDTGSGDWLQAKNMELSLLGNTYIQGSINGSTNWHNEITAADAYFRISTDGGTVWKDIDTDLVKEGLVRRYFSEARVLTTPGVQTAVNNSHTHSNKTTLDKIIGNGDGASYFSNDGTYKSGSSGTFTTTDGKTVTVTNGLITSII